MDVLQNGGDAVRKAGCRICGSAPSANRTKRCPRHKGALAAAFRFFSLIVSPFFPVPSGRDSSADQKYCVEVQFALFSRWLSEELTPKVESSRFQPPLDGMPTVIHPLVLDVNLVPGVIYAPPRSRRRRSWWARPGNAAWWPSDRRSQNRCRSLGGRVASGLGT